MSYLLQWLGRRRQDEQIKQSRDRVAEQISRNIDEAKRENARAGNVLADLVREMQKGIQRNDNR